MLALVLKEDVEEEDSMTDTLRTTCVGWGGFFISFMDWFPQLVSLGVAIATLFYMCLKIYKELKKG